MMHGDSRFDWEEDADVEGADEFDDEYLPEDEDAEVVLCPECGADVYEDAEQCPVCGQYIVHSTDYLWHGRPWWWIVLGVLGIAAVIFVLLGQG